MKIPVVFSFISPERQEGTTTLYCVDTLESPGVVFHRVKQLVDRFYPDDPFLGVMGFDMFGLDFEAIFMTVNVDNFEGKDLLALERLMAVFSG